MLEQNLQVRTIRSIDVLFPFRLRGDLDICRLSLVLEKIEGKCEGKKIERKSRMKKTVKRKKKIDLKSINYFYILLQTNFSYFLPLYKE